MTQTCHTWGTGGRVGYPPLRSRLCPAHKDLLDDISSNYSIIIDKGELHKYYVGHIFRAILSRPNSNFGSFFIEQGLLKHRIEFLAGNLIKDTTEQYNSMISLKKY